MSARPAATHPTARRRALALAACVAAGCTAVDDEAARYLGDPAFRRAELLASLVARDNGYARLRLARYESGDDADWSRLPEWNPRVEPVTEGELDAPGGAAPRAPLGPAARALDITPGGEIDLAALRALGEQAFFRYPAQLASQLAPGLASRAAAAHYGLWTDAGAGVNAVVRVGFADGTTGLAVTCASCHVARGDDGALRVGVGNTTLDMGLLIADQAVDPTRVQAQLAWGPGRVDVSSSEGTEPARIPDLRPTRFLTHLHRDATVRNRSLAALAIRIETLIITSHQGALRPPRRVALALAVYLRALHDGAAPAPPATSVAAQGRALFADRCASCHGGEGFTGPPVPLDVVGTDPTLGRSPDRGTGYYRVPSLRGVATRGALLHHGAAPSLAVLFDPRRTRADYALGARPGAIAGHPWGLELAPAERDALLEYLGGL